VRPNGPPYRAGVETLETPPGLRLTVDAAIARLTIERVDKANALTQAMWDAIPGLVEAAERSHARVLILQSATARVFSAGADIAEYSANAGSVEWGQANHVRVTAATQALAGAEIATIAAIAGPCAGGGVGLITACDLRVAADTATFTVPPAKLALVYPQPDTARLMDLVGPAAAKRLLLTAATMDAAWALRTGLVDDVVPIDQLEAAVTTLAAQISAGSPVSIRAMKRTVDLALAGQRVEDEVTRALLAEALAHADHAEGTRAFLERRAPQFSA